MNNFGNLLLNSYPWSYLLISLGVMVENAGIPVPGEIIMLTAGFLAYMGKLDPYLVIISGIIGAVIGDNIGYWAGRIGGRKLIIRISRKLHFIEKVVSRTEQYFKRYGGITVLLARFITGVRVFAGPIAGVSLMNFKKFFIYNIVGAVVWASTIVLGIMYLGGVYTQYIKDYEYADYIIYGLLFIILLLLIYKAVKKIKNFE